MDFSLVSQQFGQRIKLIPLQPLKRCLTFILIILLAWLLARFCWSLIPLPTSQIVLPDTVPSDKNTTTNVISLDKLLSYSLFGKATVQTEVAVAPVVSEAPKTTLNVKLTGVVAVKENPESGSAIIESRGSEATYAVEDRIDGTNAVLKQVLDDRVLIQQAGRFETLMLDGIEYTKIAQANAGLGREDEAAEFVAEQEPMSPVAEGPQLAVEDLQQRREELIAEPMKFFDYVRVSPQHRNGQLAGYRLMPGKDPSVFQQLGLQRNDLAVEINGVRLNDMQQAMRVINELRDAKEASIKIERDGETRDVLVSLSQ